MTNFFLFLHPRRVPRFCVFVYQPSLPGLQFRSQTYFCLLPSRLGWLWQSSVGGLLSSPSAPVPISRLETLPTQPLCWWLAALCDLIAGKAVAQWYAVSGHHLLVNGTVGESCGAGSFSQLLARRGKDSLEAWQWSLAHPLLHPQCSSRGWALHKHSQMSVELIAVWSNIDFLLLPQNLG